MKGTLIVIEGLDGGGKSTQVERLYQRLSGGQRPVRKISFPDYVNPSSALVRMYLEGAFGASPFDTNAYAASVFYAADRFASYRQFWREEYRQGAVVLADRYTEANVVHQMPKLAQTEWQTYIDWLYDLEFDKMGIPRPDLVLYFDVEPEAAERLLLRRYAGDGARRDIHERDVSYLHRCRQAALFAAKALGWQTVRCTRAGDMLPVEEIEREVWTRVRALLDRQAGQAEG